MAYELFSLAGALLSLLLVALYRLLVAPYAGAPAGPRRVALWGSWWGAWRRRQGHEDLRRVQLFGPLFTEFCGRRRALAAAEPAVARALLHDAAAHFRSRRANCVRDKFLQQGLLALEARPTKDSDHVFLLTKDSIQKVIPRILRCTSDFSSAVKKNGEESKGKVVISTLVTDFITKLLVEAVLGYDEPEDKGINMKQFTSFLNQVYHNDNPDSPFATIPFMYPTLSSLDKFVLRPRAARYFINLLAMKVQEKASAEKPAQDRHMDLLDVLFETQQLAKKKDPEGERKTEEDAAQRKEFVLVQSIAVLLNTSLTTRNLTTLGVALLAAKPQLQERVYSEMYQKLEVADEVEVAQNEYLDMFLAEVLRLYPLEYRLERECCETLQVDSVTIEKGMIVSVPVYALHRQSQFYEEPEDFNPERFSQQNKEKRDPFTFLPYGQAGDSADNISTQWSLLVAKMAIAVLVKNFKFLPAEESQVPPEFESGVTGVPSLPPLTVVMENRK